MLLRTGEFRENRRRKDRTFPTGANEITFTGALRTHLNFRKQRKPWLEVCVHGVHHLQSCLDTTEFSCGTL